MSVSRLSRQSIQAGFPKQQNVWDGLTSTSSMDAITSVTVPSGGLTSITFSSIPQTYTHLQIRCFVQETRSTYGVSEINMNINNDGGNNYSYHAIVGMGDTVAGSAVNTSASSSAAYLQIGNGSIGTTTGGTFGAAIIEILDYTNTTKNKTSRALSGVDFNGDINNYGGRVVLSSGSWYSTSSINSLTFTPSGGTNFTQYSTFSLYGIR